MGIAGWYKPLLEPADSSQARRHPYFCLFTQSRRKEKKECHAWAIKLHGVRNDVFATATATLDCHEDRIVTKICEETAIGGSAIRGPLHFDKKNSSKNAAKDDVCIDAQIEKDAE